MNSRISLRPTLEELYGTDDEIRSLPPEDVPIRILYDSPAAASISSDPVPQENIALVLTANAVSAVGGSGSWLAPEPVSYTHLTLPTIYSV